MDLARPADYRLFLTAIARALIPLEMMLERAGVSALLPDWSHRTRSQAVRHDLTALGEHHEIEVTPPDDSKPVSPAFLLGILYTLEGSRLGAAVLRERIRQSTGHGLPTDYLGHGDTRMWSSFCAVLENSPEAQAAPQEVISGANYAFEKFSQAMHLTMAART